MRGNLDPKPIADTEPTSALLSPALLDVVPVAIVRLDADCRVAALNAAAEALLGIARGRGAGRLLTELYRPRAAVDRTPLEPLPLLEPPRCAPRIVCLERADGAELTVRESWTSDGDGGGWLLAEDVTELVALRQEQQWLSFHDPVTGLPNRRALERQLEAALAEARVDGLPWAFGYLDIDDFEAVTDTFGQVAGDELVRQVAAALRTGLRADDLVARIGEVRFGVLLRDCPADQVAARSEALRRSVADLGFTWQQEAFSLGATVGVVPVAGNAELVSVLAAADAAASLARDASAAHAFDADDSMEVSLARRYAEMRWLSRIHRALKHGRLRLFRQPIVPLTAPDTGAPALYELLLRMLGPDDELIPPGLFIPAAEHFHLIGAIDRWVVRSALARLAAAPEEPYSVTINVSGASLSEARFLDDVLDALDDTGAPAERVCFEITETAAVDHLPRARRFLTALRGRGCRFVLDDFGSGLSSFAYLEELAVDFIKIDGRFVTGVAADPVRQAIVSAIRQVAVAVGVRTIGEFVEDHATRVALAGLGVDYAQGYGIQRPAPWPDP